MHSRVQSSLRVTLLVRFESPFCSFADVDCFRTEGDPRRGFTRFKQENLDSNLAVVKHISTIAEKKGVTPSQLSIAWVASLGPHMIPLPGSSYADFLMVAFIGFDRLFGAGTSLVL